MGKAGKFFLGILFPVFIFVAIVRGLMEGMSAVWTLWTVGYTLAAAAVATIIEAKLSHKPPTKPFERRPSE